MGMGTGDGRWEMGDGQRRWQWHDDGKIQRLIMDREQELWPLNDSVLAVNST